MTSHLHLIGSIVIASLLLLSILDMSSIMTNRSYENSFDNLVRERTASITETIVSDFRKIGFGVANTNKIILAFDSTFINFQADINADGVMDSLTYYLSDTTEAAGTQNPRDRYLFRRLNSESPFGIGLGVTDFKLRYFDKDGNETQNPAIIDCIEIRLTVESTIPCVVDDSLYYAQNYWQTKISPPNLLR